MSVMRIADMLPVGKQNRISAAALLRMTGEKDMRELRNRIRQERMDGALICSTKSGRGGYYLPADAEEGQEFIDTYAGEGEALLAMLGAFRAFVKAAEGGVG